MYDVIKTYPKVSDELIERYKVVDESASINECLPVNGSVEHDINPIWPGHRIVGRALTVICRPGDNLMLHKAVSMIKKNDILVVKCDGYMECGGMWGGMMSIGAKSNGGLGMIIDGCVRDTMAMQEEEFWVWAKGRNIKGSTKATPGKINHPMIFSGAPVKPGDLVFADNDSVVFVPSEIAEEVLEKVLAREAKEVKLAEASRKDGSYSFKINFQKKYEALGLSEEPDPE